MSFVKEIFATRAGGSVGKLEIVCAEQKSSLDNSAGVLPVFAKPMICDARQQFRFVTDLTVRGEAALRHAGLRFGNWPGTATATD